MSMSLMKILNDPSLLFDNERMKKKIGEVKKDKQNIVKSAQEYNTKYQKEVEEGTKKRQLLIEDGKNRGLKPEEALSGQFLPCKATPILNWLYFLLREENIDTGWEESRQKYNKEYGHLEDDYNVDESDSMEDVPNVDEFIYGSCTHDMFKKIKKLKALSKSENPNEAFIAYRMCVELCERYGLDMDRIPCNIQK